MGVRRLLLDECCVLGIDGGGGREGLRISERLGATSGPRTSPVISKPMTNQSAIANQEATPYRFISFCSEKDIPRYASWVFQITAIAAGFSVVLRLVWEHWSLCDHLDSSAQGIHMRRSPRHASVCGIYAFWLPAVSHPTYCILHVGFAYWHRIQVIASWQQTCTRTLTLTSRVPAQPRTAMTQLRSMHGSIWQVHWRAATSHQPAMLTRLKTPRG